MNFDIVERAVKVVLAHSFHTGVFPFSLELFPCFPVYWCLVDSEIGLSQAFYVRFGEHPSTLGE